MSRYQYSDPTSITIAAASFVGIQCLLALPILAIYGLLALLPQLLRFFPDLLGSNRGAKVIQILDILSSIACFSIFTGAIAILLYLFWVRHVVENAHCLSPMMTTRPTVAQFWHIVPIAHLFMPVIVLNRTWHASKNFMDPRPNIAMFVWWVLWVLYQLIWIFTPAAKSESLRIHILMGAVSTPLYIIAGCALIAFMIQLSRRQKKSYAALESPQPGRTSVAGLYAAQPTS